MCECVRACMCVCVCVFGGREDMALAVLESMGLERGGLLWAGSPFCLTCPDLYNLSFKGALFRKSGMQA